MSTENFRALATQDAVNADVIMVSCRGNPRVSNAVKAWAESWLAAGTEAMALAVLLDGLGQPDAESAIGYFKAVAKRAGIEFFAQSKYESRAGEVVGPAVPTSSWSADAASSAAGEENTECETTKLAQRTTASVGTALKFNGPRWGINE